MAGAMAQDAERPAATLWTARLIVLLTLSIIANAVLAGLFYLERQDTVLAQEMANEAFQERDLLMQLMPVIRPTVTPTELAADLRSRFPGEEVNVYPKQVQWRLFHFWFDERGRLVEVKWYS